MLIVNVHCAGHIACVHTGCLRHGFTVVWEPTNDALSLHVLWRQFAASFRTTRTCTQASCKVRGHGNEVNEKW